MHPTHRRQLGTLSLAVVLGTVSPPAKAALQSGLDVKAFVGSWTQNPARSRGTISKDLTYTFSQEADGFITIVRGAFSCATGFGSTAPTIQRQTSQVARRRGYG